MLRRNSSLEFLAVALLVAFSLPTLSCGGGGGGSSSVVVTPPTPSGSLAFPIQFLPDGAAGKTYSATLLATGGNPSYSWRLASTSSPLPSGLGLSSSGSISGTPTNTPQGDVTDYRLDIEVRDSDGRTLVGIFNIRIFGLLVVFSPTLPDGNIGTGYSAFLNAKGGRLPISWTIAAGSQPLPAGMTLGSDGHISGAPTVFGVFNFALSASDSWTPPQVATGSASIRIDNHLVVSSTSLPFGVVGDPYNASLQAAGGTPPYTWALVNTPSIFGLALSPNGVVSGVPSQALSGAFEVMVTDSSTPSASVHGFVNIFFRPVLSFSTTPPFDGVLNQSYFSHFAVDGGRPPFTMKIISGTFPPGIGLTSQDNNAGFYGLSGNPSALGSFPIAVEVSDSASSPHTITTTYVIRISTRLSITSSTAPNGIVGDPYTLTLAATGGIPPYTWIGATIPQGLTLDSSSGQITGIPTQPFGFQLAVNVRDQSFLPQVDSWSFPVRIAGRLELATKLLPSIRVGAPIQLFLGTTGGVGPFNWSMSAGSLPHGLTFNSSSGSITGIATTTESQSFTLQLSDPGPPQQTTTGTLSLSTAASPGRNDSIATATAVSNGRYRASISPPDNTGVFAPDNDFYQVTAAAGSVVTIETFADRLTPFSPLDTVLEIQDLTGTRLNACNSFNPGSSGSPCMNDDIPFSGTTDSRLFLLVPGAPGTQTTFYIRVLSWDGHARPEYTYEIQISGAK